MSLHRRAAKITIAATAVLGLLAAQGAAGAGATPNWGAKCKESRGGYAMCLVIEGGTDIVIEGGTDIVLEGGPDD